MNFLLQSNTSYDEVDISSSIELIGSFSHPNGVLRLTYPVGELVPQAMLTSDHVPFLLQCKQLTTRQIAPELERLWLNYDEASTILTRI